MAVEEYPPYFTEAPLRGVPVKRGRKPKLPGLRKNPFAHIPRVIKEEGRIRGFEEMRDTILRNWSSPALERMNAYSAIKAVLESDRHALFAGVAEAKTGKESDEKWAKFQDYLEGKVEGLGPVVEEEQEDIAPVKEKINAMLAREKDQISEEDRESEEVEEE